jgi:hypothetical protein
MTLADGLKYHFQVERVYKMEGRGASRTKVLKRETVTVRENSQQGDVIYASPLEWLDESFESAHRRQYGIDQSRHLARDAGAET